MSEKYKADYQKLSGKSNVILDASIVIMVAALAVVFAVLFDLHDAINLWTKRFETKVINLHEALFLALAAALSLAIFAVRRWREVRHEIRERKKTEAELEKYRAQLEKMVEERSTEILELNKKIEFILGATKTGLDIIDSEYNMVYVDPEWAKKYGDFKGKKCYQYFMGRETRCPECGIRKALETKKMVVTEELLAKEGNRPVQVTTVPYQDKNGAWLVAEVNVDMTERKKAEEDRLRADTLEAIIKGIPDAVVVHDALGRVIQFNQAFTDLFGYGEEVVGAMPTIFVADSDKPKVEESLKGCLARGSYSNLDVTAISKDGKAIQVLVNVSLYSDLSGKAYGMIAVIRDISELKEAEEALRISEASYRAIFEMAGDPIVIRDIKTYAIVDANNKACEMFCRPKEEMIGLGLGDFITNSPDYALKKLEGLYKKVLQGEPQIFEWLVKDKMERQFWVEVSVNRTVIGGRYRFISIMRDITERKSA